MPPPPSVPGFVDLVRKSGVVDDARLNEEVQSLRTTNPGATVDQAAQALVKAGVLTRFQAKQIKNGRYKKFFLSGKYKILELIGTGGMGAVYLCEHGFMKRLVAVKVLPVEKLADPSNLERFYREARVIAAMDHPNIVRAYNIEQAENLHFLVMEYVDGASLQEIVARFGPLDPKRVVNYAFQAAVGLRHAADLGLVHRDIKPGNLLLERTGVIKILDMGLARFFLNESNNDKLTERFDAKCILGTADYLAPEQAMTSKVDIRADLYGLGGTMYFLLTGRSPVPDGNVTQKLLFQQKHDPPPVTRYRSDVPAELLTVLTKLMKKNPDERYQTPDELMAALLPMTEPTLLTPPEFEMPDLCPAVMGLTGHLMDRQRRAAAALSSAVGQTYDPAGAIAVLTAGPTTPPAPGVSRSDVHLLNPEFVGTSSLSTKALTSTPTPIYTPGPAGRPAAIFATPAPRPPVEGPTFPGETSGSAAPPEPADESTLRWRIGVAVAVVLSLVVVGLAVAIIAR
jgi:serine/threonine protein kinase